MSEPGVILVTGSTGNVGRSLVSQLLEVGAEVTALARDPGSARLPGGASVVAGDLSRPATLREALDGVGAVFLLWPFTDADAAPAVVDVLAGAGPRVVFLSSMGSQADQAEAGTAFHAAVERELRRSGLAWTFLRPGGFASNTLLWAPQIRTDGVVRWPYARAARSLIHERDIAAVAVRCLTDGHGNGEYGVGGRGAGGTASADGAVGRRRRCTAGTAAAGTAGPSTSLPGPWPSRRRNRYTRSAGPSAGRCATRRSRPTPRSRRCSPTAGRRPFAEHALAHWATLVEQPEPVTDTVERLTGTAARTFGEWARDHADDFR